MDDKHTELPQPDLSSIEEIARVSRGGGGLDGQRQQQRQQRRQWKRQQQRQQQQQQQRQWEQQQQQQQQQQGRFMAAEPGVGGRKALVRACRQPSSSRGTLPHARPQVLVNATPFQRDRLVQVILKPGWIPQLIDVFKVNAHMCLLWVGGWVGGGGK